MTASISGWAPLFAEEFVPRAGPKPPSIPLPSLPCRTLKSFPEIPHLSGKLPAEAPRHGFVSIAIRSKSN
jgi:hypothetical protein